MGLQWAQKEQCLLQISTWQRLKQTSSNKVTPSQRNGSNTLMMFSPFGTVTEYNSFQRRAIHREIDPIHQNSL